MAAKKETVTLPEEEVRVEEEKVGEDLVPPLNIDPDNAEEPAGEAETSTSEGGSEPEEKVGEDLVPPLNIDPDNAEEPAGEAETSTSEGGSEPEEKVGEDLVPPLNIDPDNAEEPAGEAPEKDTLQDLVEYYKNRYPDNKTFHITSDGMFFLEKDLNLAYLHQRSLSSGEIKSVTV